MSEWQPIETAPRDGTRILVWSPTIEKVKMAFYDANYGYMDMYPHEFNLSGWICADTLNEFSEMYGNLPDPNPSHWMPLPEPPKVEG